VLLNVADGSTGGKCKWVVTYGARTIGKIEWLAHGQQTAIAGRHYSGSAITWHLDGDDHVWSCPPVKDVGLPTFPSYVAAKEMLALAFEELSAKQYEFQVSSEARGNASGDVDPKELAPADLTPDHLIDVFGRMSNPASVGRDDYKDIMLASGGAMRGIKAHRDEAVTDEPSADDYLVADAAAKWAARWEGNPVGTHEEERQKWLRDFRLNGRVAGWRQFVSHADKLGAGIAMESAQREFSAEQRPEGETGRYRAERNDGSVMASWGDIQHDWYVRDTSNGMMMRGFDSEEDARKAIPEYEREQREQQLTDTRQKFIDELFRADRREKRKFLSLKDIRNLPSAEWLVEGLIEEESLVTIYGPPGSCKSFLALSTSLCTAAGIPWFGRAMKQGAVIYVAAEGANGMKRRVEAMQADLGVSDDIPFWLVPATVDFSNKYDVAEFVGDLRALVPSETPIRLVVFDTLFCMANGLDINAPAGMGAVVAALGAVKRGLKCTVMPIHHEGKDSSKGMLGSVNLLGTMDTTIRTTRDKTNGRVCFHPQKQKDGDPGKALVFEMETVATSDGRTTLLPRLLEGAKPADETELPPQVGLALQALESAIRDEGKPIGKGRRRAVPVKLWRERFSDKLATKPDETPRQAADRKSKAFNRANEKLQYLKLIEVEKEMACLIDKVPGSEFDADQASD
jgi:hypothetical protein